MERKGNLVVQSMIFSFVGVFSVRWKKQRMEMIFQRNVQHKKSIYQEIQQKPSNSQKKYLKRRKICWENQ